MYCTKTMELSNDVVVVVTEVKPTPEKFCPVSIVAGYAFKKDGTELPFWDYINKSFVNNFVDRYLDEIYN